MSRKKITKYTREELNVLLEEAKKIKGDKAFDIIFKAVDGKKLTEDERILVAFNAYCHVDNHYKHDLARANYQTSSAWIPLAIAFPALIALFVTLFSMPYLPYPPDAINARLFTSLIFMFIMWGIMSTPLVISAYRYDQKRRKKLPQIMSEQGWEETYQDRTKEK